VLNDVVERSPEITPLSGKYPSIPTRRSICTGKSHEARSRSGCCFGDRARRHSGGVLLTVLKMTDLSDSVAFGIALVAAVAIGMGVGFATLVVFRRARR
jgi:hypothetical protein